MLSLRTLLVPVDFEDASERALETAADLAATFGAKILVVHAYELPFYPYPGGAAPTAATDLPKAIRDAATVGLDTLVRRTKERTPNVEGILRMGPPADEILACAREHQADLIVMGTHGRSGLRHALLGSVAEKVVRRSEIPVWTARGKKAP
jgi:nucleotide-binding universal stress UspA family protein